MLIRSTDSKTAKSMMPAYHLGTLDENSKLALKDDQNHEKELDAPSPIFLAPRSWKKAVLHARRSISWDTQIFTFELEHEDQALGLPVGQHLLLRLHGPSTQETIIRPYTPIPTGAKKGYMDILIKLYLDTKTRKGGKMSKALDALSIGDGVDFKGPIGKFEYHGRGYCSINRCKKKFDRFGMICAGSGITPVYQVLHSIMNDAGDETKCTLLNGNRTAEDILCRENIDALIKGSEERAKVVYTLTQATEVWEGLKGRIDADLISRYCKRDESTLILVCGPDALEKSVATALREQGWLDEQILFF